MKKEYSKPELNIAEYIIDTQIAEDPSGAFANGFRPETDGTANWADFQ